MVGNRVAGYGGYTEEQGTMYGGYTEEEGMVGMDIHLTLNVHRQLVSKAFNTVNTFTHSQTLSLALISAPLSSRATTVAVWPSFDER